MGNVFQEQGNLDNAVKAYIKAISIKPDFAETYTNMGVALTEQGKLEEALEAFNKALDIKPDNVEAYSNSTELLKIYSSKIERSNKLFNIDCKIKKLSSKLLHTTSSKEIINSLLEGFSYIGEESFKFKTPLSQIYKRNVVDLNCRRHRKIFNTKNIIPEFCFGCFKVQVEVATVIDLIVVTSLFYKFDFEEDLTRKTIIELWPDISGFYKGLIYCKGLDQAQAVKRSLDIDLKKVFSGQVISKIKRGCSEYPMKFPEYGKISSKSQEMMKFPKKWKLIERQFDKEELIKPKQNTNVSLSEFCLSDFYIMQKWVDYAKGIGDQSINTFSNMPIIFKDIYEVAKKRAKPC